MENQTIITIKATINAPVETVWQLWTEPQHIVKWNAASDDWHTTKSENDLRVGGSFTSRMEAKDGSFGFDFGGIYDTVKHLHQIDYTMGDGRKAWTTFSKQKEKTKIVTKFVAENQNAVELQQMGWQAILNNFKKYAESNTPSVFTPLITPFLWFENQLEDAVKTYVSLFPNSKIKNTMYHSTDSPQAGQIMTMGFNLAGQEFAGINGGPHFKLNPSISLYVACKTTKEVDKYWNVLIKDGMAMMPLDKYPWSEKYGFLQDRFGMSWQITLDKNIEQKITPSMLFTEGVHGKGKEAFEFYTSLFKNASLIHASYYEKGQNQYATEGMVLFSLFNLNGQNFIIMDAGMPQPYTFNEALSYIINCETQEEVDYYWHKIIDNGGQESQCGWCKDKFGVSWQVIPSLLFKLMGDKNTAKAKAATFAMFKMKKMIMADLQKAFDEA